MKQVAALFTSIAFLVLFSVCASAQGLSTVVGTVTDPSGGLVPGAKVTIVQQTTGLTRTFTTDAQGEYVFPSLRPSKYTLTVEAPGFNGYRQTDIELLADQSATVNIKLELGAASQTVSVVESTPQVDTYTPTLKEVVDQRRIVELPLNGRNAAELTTLVPGVSVDVGPGNDADQGSTKTFPSAVTISTNGSRQNSVNFLLDGGNNVDQFTNVNMPFPFPDALQEFSVQTSNYSARYGQNGGGVVNIVTKSGTNQWHGDAFEFVRNKVFNARNFFAEDRDQLKRNQFGGTFGGPLSIPHIYNGKDRTFFFLGAQGTTIRNTFGTQSANVPTDANLRGDFSSLLNANDPNNITGMATQLVNPASGQAFPGNQIPTSMFDPASLNLVKFLPRSSGNGLVHYPSNLGQNYYEMIGRVDQSIGSADRLFFRYFGDHFQNDPVYLNNNLLTDTAGASIFSQNYIVSETHTFRPNLLNDFNFTYGRIFSHRGPGQNVPSVRDLGVNIYQPAEYVGIQEIDVNGYFGLGNTPPAEFIRNTFSWTDNVTWVKGRHNISFGGEITRARLDINNFFRTPGVFSFTGDATGNSMADFLLGRIRLFNQGMGQYGRNRNTFAGLYAQDTFRATRRLSLDFGLRWDPWFPVHELRGRLAQFRPDAYYRGERSQVFTNALPGEFFPGDPGVPRDGLRSSLNQFAPRIGFAYDVSGDGKTSIRGGVGMFYDSRSVMTTNWEMLDNTPFSPQLALTAPVGGFSNPLQGIANPFPAPFPPPRDAAFPQPVLVVAYDPSGRFQVPTTYQWNFTVERQLVSNWLLRVGYVGSHASHIRESIDLNPAVYTPGSTLGPDERRLFQGYSDIFIGSQAVNSNYHSLQVTLEKRFSRSYSILANYTWSKSIDDLPWAGGVTSVGGDTVSPLPWYDPNFHSMDRGPSEFDRTHVFVMSNVWEFPKFAGMNRFVRGVAGGWQLNGILKLQSGDPLTILAGTDRSQTALGRDRAQDLGGDHRLSGPCANAAPCVNWLNPSTFGLPAIGTFGNVGKGSLRGPGYFNVDLGLFKSFDMTERMRLQFRAEFFNAFNHTNFSDPGNTIGGGFGQIYSASDPRIGQLALKLLF